MAKVTWNGAPHDPDSIVQYGVTFPRGEAVEVDSDHPKMAKFAGNAYFSIEDSEEEVDGEDGASASVDESLPFTAVHKGGGKWIVEGPEGTPDYGPFKKAEAVAKAEELNASASKPVDGEDGA